MNTNTGEIRKLATLTVKDRESGEWVPVSDLLAAAAGEVNLAKVVRERKARLEQLEGLRKEGRR